MEVRKLMSVNLSISLLLLYALTSQSCNSERIVQKGTSAYYPTVYTFKSKPEHFGELFRSYYFKYHNGLNFYLTDIAFNGEGVNKISVEEAKQKGLINENNKYDVWMMFFVDSSETYFSKAGKPLKYFMECKAHVEPVSADSIKVEIQVIEAKVQTGTSKLPSPPHFVKKPIYKKVNPTAIDQYKILLCFGKGLGIVDEMPKLISK